MIQWDSFSRWILADALLATSPITNQLAFNIIRAYHGDPVNQGLDSQTAMDLQLNSDAFWQENWSHPYPNPTMLCFPAQCLINGIEIELLSWGLPGLTTQDIRSLDEFLATLERGAIAGPVYGELVVHAARYILHFWLIWKGWFDNPLEWLPTEATFRLNDNPADSYPPSGPDQYQLEWRWLLSFLNLAIELNEPELITIPSYFGTVGKFPEIQKLKKDEVWIEKRQEAIRGLARLPYSFRLEYERNKKGEVEEYRVFAKARPCENPEAALMATLCTYEHLILTRLQDLRMTWMKLRSSHNLKVADINQDLLNGIDWQRGMWPMPFQNDNRLNTTAMRATFIQPKTVQEKRVDPLRRDLDTMFNKNSGIKKGISHALKVVEADDEALILKLIPDLEKILRVARPPFWEVGAQKGKVKKLKLTYIQPKHLNFNWDQVKGNDRLDFCSKIVCEYIKKVTQKRYTISAIYRFLSGKLPK
jgi:hypothetical protein